MSPEPKLNKKRITRAASRVMQIHGYLSYNDALLIGLLMEFQRHVGVFGGAAEIGVHHGRLLLLMAQLLSKEERSVAIDLFDAQDRNLDRSGKGNKSIFLNHCIRLNLEKRIDIFSSDSRLVTPEQIVSSLLVQPRIFSVDGSHISDVVLVDMKTAEQSVCVGGIVLIDDYWNYGWPDVSHAVQKHLNQDGSNLYPFAVSSAKLLLAKGRESAKRYFEFLLNQRFVSVEKIQKMGCDEVIVFENRSFLELSLIALRLARRDVRMLFRHLKGET
jgi:hypothetical protein